MQAAYFRLEHSVANKSNYDSSYMAAHANYCANQNKCSRVIGINMPVNRYQIQGTLNHYAKSLTRKNANLFHKVLLSHPHQLSEAHRYQATRRFLMRVTEGRSRAVAFFHDQESHNPHAHIMLLDTDVDTGRSVAQLSSNWARRRKAGLEPNPTEWLRKVWEEECSAVMEEHEYGLYLDRRSNLERGLEPAGEHRGYDNDNYEEAEPEITEEPAKALKAYDFDTGESLEELTLAAEDNYTPPPDAPLTEVEDEEPEEDFEDHPSEDTEMNRADRFAWARVQANELRVLKAKKLEQQKLRTEYAYWRTEAQTAREKAEIAHEAAVAAAQRTAIAEQAYKDTHLLGFRKGLNIKLGPIQIRTSGIEKAIRAEAEYSNAAYSEALKGATLREAHHYADRATLKVMELEKKVEGLEHSIEHHEKIFGIEQDFNGAEGYFKEQLDNALKGLSPNDIMDAYESGEITIEETKDILHHMGHEDLVNWIEAQQEEPLH